MSIYSDRIQNIFNRINPDNIDIDVETPDSYIIYSDVCKYVSLAMKGVDPLYTRRSKEAGEKVKGHLDKDLRDVEYEYQGSVMTDTHIKGNSDIDLLVISSKFYTFDRSGIQRKVNEEILSPEEKKKLQKELDGGGYSSGLSDLKYNRERSEIILSEVYEDCDCSHAKAIKIKNRSLNREIDIVIANWYDDSTSVLNNKNKPYRGIQVYNKELGNRESADYPFLSIERINDRSSNTNGRLKKMIRFIKNIRADSPKKIEISSFDINAICYGIDVLEYQHKSKYELVEVIYKQLIKLINDHEYRNNLRSVDGKEYIFRDKEDKLQSIDIIISEIKSIINDLNNVGVMSV